MGLWAILPAGGNGERFRQGGQADKLLATLQGRPVLAWSAEAVLAAEAVEGLAVACRAEARPGYEAVLRPLCERYGKPLRFAPGGATRRESVAAALAAVPEGVAWVAVHDAARPLLPSAWLDGAFAWLAARADSMGAVPALPIADTVKRKAADGDALGGTVDREALLRVQTPQILRRDILAQAHRAVPADTPVTDDAQLVELAGLGAIAWLPGPACNVKVTEPDDLRWADAWLAR